jgi:hypothetical protein
VKGEEEVDMKTGVFCISLLHNEKGSTVHKTHNALTKDRFSTKIQESSYLLLHQFKKFEAVSSSSRS